MMKRSLTLLAALALVAGSAAALACSTDIEGPKLKSKADEDEPSDSSATTMLPGVRGEQEMLARILFPGEAPRG